MNGRKLVIGYGNPLRSDDGVGWRVASRLATSVPSETARILTVHQLTPELAEPISEAELVIFIDASAVGKPGTWKCEQIAPRPASRLALGHFFDASELLACSQAIYNATPQALLVSIAAQSFELQDDLTPDAEALLPDIVSFIRGKVLFAGTPQPTFC